MNILQEAMIAYLSGLTTKTNNEIHWKNDLDHQITIEPIDVTERIYVIRYYWANGNRRREINYKNDKQHGKLISWFENGQKHYEAEYRNGKMDGKYIGWRSNGSKSWETNFVENRLDGHSVAWDTNGNKSHDIEYRNNRLIKILSVKTG